MQFALIQTGGAFALESMLIKSQLIAKISKIMSHLPEREIVLAVNRIIAKFDQVLSEGGRIEVRGFGSFSLHYRPSRKAHNPRTGERLITEPKYAVHFKPGKELREQVNVNKHIPISEMSSEED